ncbi:hypothetical protein D3C86_1738230 [compost metagenome]
MIRVKKLRFEGFDRVYFSLNIGSNVYDDIGFNITILNVLKYQARPPGLLLLSVEIGRDFGQAR